MEDLDIKKEYEKLTKKHDLPNFEDLDNDFELRGIQHANKELLLRYIRRRINEKIVFFSRILESIIHPNTNSIISMQENKAFTEKEKEELVSQLNVIMKMDRESLRIDIHPNDKDDTTYINHVHKELPGIRDKILKVTEKMKEAWVKKEALQQEDYFG